MKFVRADLNSCQDAQGIVVVIDVLRAFSTAAYALAAGAAEILMVAEIEQALTLRADMPGSLIVGELAGLPVPGFDFCNSPVEIVGQDLSGRRLIQRTSAGTQGMVRSQKASLLLGGSLVCASATAAYIQQVLAADPGLEDYGVTFVLTGLREGGYGDEDAACAETLEALLRGEAPDLLEVTQKVRRSPWGRIFADPARPEFPAEDLDLCLQVDRFDFAMPVRQLNGHLVLKKEKSPG